MKKNLKKILVSFLTASSIFAFVACNRTNGVASVKENNLFSIDYGSFEDELNLFNLSSPGAVNTYITMLDGFFYIANGESKKIMELNSYGDLLSLYYNPDVTKKPSFASDDSVNSTKKAVEYPFNKLGPVAVDSRKNIFAVDCLPQERQEIDTENRLLLNSVVLWFNSDGTFIDYLGQQGPGGTPFPHITEVYVTTKDELVVVSKTNEGPVVFWFNEAGFLLYKIPFTDSTVPKLKDTDEEGNSYVSIHKVIPDNVNHRLFVQVDYFQSYLDPATKVQSGIDFKKTILYPLDVETGRYGEGLDIPPHEEAVAEKLSKEVYKIPFDFTGVTDSGWLFFIVPIDRGYLVQMVQPNGQKIIKRVLPVDHSQILYYSLGVSGNGIVSGLFVKKDHAEVAWWRTDSLVGGLMN